MATSTRINNMPFASVSNLMTATVEARTKKGLFVYDMFMGKAIHKPPAKLFSNEGIAKDHLAIYESPQGNYELRTQWSTDMNMQCSACLMADHLMITNGASDAITYAMAACCDPGEELIVLNPFYVNYIGIASLTNVKLLPIERDFGDKFSLPLDKISDYLNRPSCKGILISNPENPTGYVWKDYELDFLAQACAEKDKFLIADEVYRQYFFFRDSPSSLLSAVPKNSNIIIADSFSKQFNLAGIRLGAMITSNRNVMRIAATLMATRLGVSAAIQKQASYLYKDFLDKHDKSVYYKNIAQQINNSRLAMLQEINNYPLIETVFPEGGIFMIAKLPVKNVIDFALFLIDNFSLNGKTVLLSPAASFYMNSPKGKDETRLTFALEPEQSREVITIIGEGLKAYNRVLSGTLIQ